MKNKVILQKEASVEELVEAMLNAPKPRALTEAETIAWSTLNEAVKRRKAANKKSSKKSNTNRINIS